MPMRDDFGFGKLVLFLGLATDLGSPVLAQGQSGPTREELQRGQLDQQLRSRAEDVRVDGEIERSPCPLAAPQFADIRFTLREARFTTIEGLDPALVTPAFADLIGQELPVAAVCDIRDKAAQILRDAGYLAAVQVPAQTIDDGVVRFDIIVARMSDVQIRGSAGPSEQLLQRYVQKLVGQPVFNLRDAERYLLLARDIPGLDVRLTLRPRSRESGGQPGEVIGEFNVVRTPVYADINIQNFGSEAVGRFGGLARVRINGLTGLGDETIASIFTSHDFDEQQVVQASHEMRLGGEGFKLGGSFTYAWTNPDVPGDDVFRSETLIGSLYASFPFVRKQASNIIGTIGFDLIDQNVRFTGLPLSEDNLRIAYARVDFNAVEATSVFGKDGYSAFEPRYGIYGSFEVRQGLGFLGASEGCGPGLIRCLDPNVVPPGRLDGDPTAFLIRAQAKIDYRPTPLLTLTLKPRLQWSPDALFSYEEISGGNYTSGRGFDPGAVIGDSGYGLQSEIAYGSLVPATPKAIAWQPFLFFDMMGVYNHNVAGDPDIIYAAGGGIRATIGRQATLEAFAAAPLNRAPLDSRRRDARALVTLTVQLAPWYQ